LQTIPHICKNVHSTFLYQISYAYFLRFTNYHQKPEFCVKNFDTTAMSCQYPKTAAYLSKSYNHTSLQGMMVLVSMPPHNFVCQPCCYCQLSKTLDRHTHTHTQNIHNHSDLIGQLTFLKNGKHAINSYSFKMIYILMWDTDSVAQPVASETFRMFRCRSSGSVLTRSKLNPHSTTPNFSSADSPHITFLCKVVD